MQTIVVKAGAIEARKPRPLTEAERTLLRKRNGGDATAADLARLADAFAKPERTREANRDNVTTVNNGWTR